MKEIWKDIEGFEGLYQVSNLGRVKSLQMYSIRGYIRREKIMKPCNNGKGYCNIFLAKNKKRHICYIHRLVAKAFIPNPNNFPVINHKDENKENNAANNLEWCTQKYNNNYGTHNERSKKAKMIKVEQLDLDGNLIKVWDGIRLAMKETGTSHIVECCKGKMKKSNGYIWRYSERDN